MNPSATHISNYDFCSNQVTLGERWSSRDNHVTERYVIPLRLVKESNDDHRDHDDNDDHDSHDEYGQHDGPDDQDDC